MSIPEGFKLVPVEPTAEMINAGQDQEFTVDVYAAMLAAAPAPPQPIYSALNFVCTALPGPGNECAFVELENEAGESLGHGEWRNREDGLVELHIAAPQHIYDEARERELFEVRIHRIAVEKGYQYMAFLLKRDESGEYQTTWVDMAWLGWSERAQSRAKSVEVGDE